jgi:hypothetical protein
MDTRASRLEAGEAYVLELAPTEPGSDPVSAERPLRVLQWNIERGYELPRILDVLQGSTPTSCVYKSSISAAGELASGMCPVSSRRRCG